MVSYVFQGDERPQLYTVVWRGRPLARLVVLSEALPKGQIELGYHAAGAASAPDVTPPGPRGPTRDALQILPADLLRALRHAVAAANHGELLALVDRAAAHDARLGAQLRDLAESYDDETLHHLLAPDSSTL